MIKSLNRQLSFFLITLIGVVYLATIFLTAHKVLSSFIMQLIYLIDHQITSYQLLLTNLFFGFLYFYFFFLLGRGLVVTIRNLVRTRYPTPSQLPVAFTYGLFRPRVYISPAAKDITTPEELRAILLHEQSHCRNFDPLKNLIVNFIQLTLPVFPLKNYLFSYYFALVEVSCDQFACSQLKSPRPIASALAKILATPSPVFSSFSAQSERIRILTGHSRLPHFRPASLYLGLLFLISLSFVSISHTSVFSECHHLIYCLELLASPPHPASCH